MVARCGMDPEFGAIRCHADRTPFPGQTGRTTYLERRYGEAMAAKVDPAV